MYSTKLFESHKEILACQLQDIENTLGSSCDKSHCVVLFLCSNIRG